MTQKFHNFPQHLTEFLICVILCLSHCGRADSGCRSTSCFPQPQLVRVIMSPT